MKLRVILACTLLLLAAFPSFAAPPCRECNDENKCEIIDGAFARCLDTGGTCRLVSGFCTSFSHSTVLTDWAVASIEISQPAQECVTDAAPAAEAPTPALQTTELN